jgi:RHH-type rel operon transcriptional repressor/antitoxin RelB
MLAIRLTPSIEKRLDRLAKKTGRTKTHYARQAILAYLQDMEDIAAAEQEFREIAADRTRKHSLKGMLKANGLEIDVDRKGAPKLRRARLAIKKAPAAVSRRKNYAA